MAVDFIPAKELSPVGDKSYPLWGAGLDERDWEGNQGQSGRFTANLIFRPSFTTSYHSPNHQKHDLLFLPQNCDTECVSPNPFQV